MNKTELTTTVSLASIFAFRMLGLFIILPIFALYAHQLNGATPTSIGLALGIYGLTQGCFQIPFGMLSDKFGRKPLIVIGLVIFAIGSLVAALSHSITGIIIGRALQGMGAIGSVIIALLADLTQEQHRTQAMAIIGMTIGITFAVSIVISPLLNTLIGVPGIFGLTAILALIGITILFLGVATPQKLRFHPDIGTIPALFKTTLKNLELLRLNLGIFSLHAILTATFIVVPLLLKNSLHIAAKEQWLIYLPALVLAFITMIPFIIIAEKKRKMKPILISAITALGIAQMGLLVLSANIWLISICLWIFFTAFTLLEASLPSLVSKISPTYGKGTAIGIYSTCQFLGIFFGGSLGGWLYGQHHLNGVLIFCLILLMFWLIAAITMKPPRYLTTIILNLPPITTEMAATLRQRLVATSGIAEAVIDNHDHIAYLKFDKQLITLTELEQIIHPEKKSD